jgi:hypothetical protein
VLDHETDFRSAYQALMKQKPVSVEGRELAFTPLPVGQSSIERATDLRRHTDYEIFSARVPKQRKEQKQQFIVDYSKRAKDPRAGWHYWVADRPMFVRDIKIDVRNYPRREDLEFDVVPFLGSVENLGACDFVAGECLIVVNRWLVRGQGFCVVWTPRSGTPTRAHRPH